MIEVRLEDVFDEYGIYNVNDIICNLDKYLGYNYNNLLSKLKTIDKEVITEDDVINHCIYNYDKLYESKFLPNITMNVIEKRKSDYRTFYKILNIYRKKGLNYLSLLNYLKNLDSGMRDEKYEKLLSELDISHYKSIVCGRDIIKILNALKNIILKCDENIFLINNMDTYNFPNYNTFALNSTELYPNSSLVNDDRCLDKTSINVNNRKRKIRMA